MRPSEEYSVSNPDRARGVLMVKYPTSILPMDWPSDGREATAAAHMKRRETARKKQLQSVLALHERMARAGRSVGNSKLVRDAEAAAEKTRQQFGRGCVVNAPVPMEGDRVFMDGKGGQIQFVSAHFTVSEREAGVLWDDGRESFVSLSCMEPHAVYDHVWEVWDDDEGET